MSKLRTRQYIPEATWSLYDVVVVTLGTTIFSVGGMVIVFLAFGNGKIAHGISRFLLAGPWIFGPIFWLRKKYGLSTKALGLQKSSSGALASLLLGIVSAVAYITGMWPLLLGIDWQVILKALEYSHYHILIMFLTLNGFGSIVLTPISEEIMFRGFIYSYLRKNLGLIAGIVVQALVFSLLHLGEDGNVTVAISLTNRFIVGLILGWLYERTGSLLAPITCHGVINYFAWVILFVAKPS